MSIPRVLVADLRSGVKTIRAVLGDSAKVSSAQRMDQAIAALEEGVELIVCGIHFDDSRMFDFLRIVKADPRDRSIPFVCFRDLESDLAPALLESLDISSRALGAECFLDLFELKARHGVEAADEEFRQILLRIALPST